MYGMMHRAIRQMVTERAGSEVWQGIERELGVGPAEFISAIVHPDELTVAMLAAAAERLGLSMHACMRAFGRYWVHFAERGPYGAMMDFVGQDIVSFIANLDRMHQAVRVAMPGAQVPQFTMKCSEERRLLVRYRSTRSGFEPMVQGLLEGLLERFGHTGSVTAGVKSGETVEFAVELAGP